MMNFKFNLNAKKVRITNDDLLSSLGRYAEKVNFKYFPTTEYDRWKDKVAHSCTICNRFGSWNKALKVIGVEGGHEWRYSPDELMENLENVWKKIGYPPGKRLLAKYGQKISESPYRKIGEA